MQQAAIDKLEAEGAIITYDVDKEAFRSMIADLYGRGCRRERRRGAAEGRQRHAGLITEQQWDSGGGADPLPRRRRRMWRVNESIESPDKGHYQDQ